MLYTNYCGAEQHVFTLSDMSHWQCAAQEADMEEKVLLFSGRFYLEMTFICARFWFIVFF